MSANVHVSESVVLCGAVQTCCPTKLEASQAVQLVPLGIMPTMNIRLSTKPWVGASWQDATFHMPLRCLTALGNWQRRVPKRRGMFSDYQDHVS